MKSVSLLCAVLLGSPGFAVTAADPKPNIVFILTDDLGYGDVGVFFQNQRREKNDRAAPWLHTPQLDAMAAGGLQLRQHYCPAPVCAPSRASLLTGVHQGHAHVRDNQFDKALEENHTLATVLKGAGYATALIGKWGLQGPGKTPAEWPAYPTKRGFDFFHGYVRHKDGHGHYPREDKKELWENGREISADLAGCYTTDLFTARAKKWITDHRAAQSGQPFFLFLAYDTPHAKTQLPPSPYPEGAGAKGGVQWLGQPERMINAAGSPDSYLHPDYAGATWDHDRDAATPEQPWPDVYRRYATSVRRIDDAVGDLFALLRDLEIDRDTLVIFTSDNGPSRESYLPQNFVPNFFHSFGPMDGIKRDLWEGGIRVGALVRWPARVPAGRVSEAPSQFHDWMPMFAEAAGVPVPARADGVSLVPTLTGQGTQRPSTVYIEYQAGEKTPPYPEFEASRRGRERRQMQALRSGDFMGVRYRVEAHADPFEIYNVVADPKQAQNLAAEKPELQRQLHDAVLRLRMPGPGAARPYDGEFVPALPPAISTPGVKCDVFTGAMRWLARLDEQKPAATDTAAEIAAIERSQNATAFLVRGFLTVPAAGVYRFHIPTGASALLRIHAATVLDAGFAPAPEDASGSIRLAAGPHPFQLHWRSTPAAPTPRLDWTRPDGAREPVPAAAVSRGEP